MAGGLLGHDSHIVPSVTEVFGPLLQVIRVGGDGTGQTFGRYRFANNTIVLGQATTSALFRVFDGIESIEMYGNAFLAEALDAKEIFFFLANQTTDGADVRYNVTYQYEHHQGVPAPVL